MHYSFTICQELEVKIMFLLNTVLKIIKTLLINNYSLNSPFVWYLTLFNVNVSVFSHWMLLVAMVGSIGLVIALMVYKTQTPTNYILLALFVSTSPPLSLPLSLSLSLSILFLLIIIRYTFIKRPFK